MGRSSTEGMTGFGPVVSVRSKPVPETVVLPHVSAAPATRRLEADVTTSRRSSNTLVSIGRSDVPSAVAVFPSMPLMKERTAICSSRARPSVSSIFTPSDRRCEMVEEREYCLLYTSDAADEEDSVDLGGRRIIKKKKQ